MTNSKKIIATTQGPNTEIKLPEQDAIMDFNGNNLIVSASAGSGKTTVMIKKIVKHILNKDCHVDELLVLTYTKSAAGEMKKKLVDKLRDNAENNPELENEIELVQSSDISTFDSFCQKLVKKYFYVLNIDPSFSILDEGEQNYNQGIALNKAIKELKTKNPEIYEKLLENLSPKRNEDKIKEIILQLYTYTTSILNLDNFVKKTENLYKKDQKIAENYLICYYDSIFDHHKKSLEKLKAKCANLGFDKYVIYINNLIINLEAFLCEKSFYKKIDFANTISFGRLQQSNNDEINLKDTIAKERDSLKKVLTTIKSSFANSQAIEESYEECSSLAIGIINLLKIFIDKYTLLKQSINAYDFNDIERLTIKLLENCSAQEEVKNTYKYIFVDEFQDANSVQEKIIFLIENNNLFFVGDKKQSIYAFRQSDPEIFSKLEERFLKEDGSDSKRLNCNFRTNKNILDFVNNIFSIIMTTKTADLDYKNKAMFDARAPYEDINGEVCVSLNIINGSPQDDKKEIIDVYNVKENAFNSTFKNSHDDECSFICHEIIRLLGEKIYDKDLKATRELNLSDITILVSRRNSFLTTLTKHLSELGIPYIIGANENLEEVYDNLVLYNLLKISQNMNDDYALYTVLSSALFNFLDDDLANIRLFAKDCKYFYECLNKKSECNDLLGQKIRSFIALLNDFSFNVKHKGIFFALNNIITKTNYLLNISFEDNYPSRKLNIETYINSFVNSKYNYDVCAYLIYRDVAIRQEGAVKDTPAGDAIQITTMHSSKGLEYPVVFLPCLETDNFKSPGGSEIKINKDFGIGVKAYNDEERSVNKGIFYEACRLKNKEEEQSEKIRLLYVATTRAKNKLILSGKNQKNYFAFSNDYEIMNCNNYLSMILNSLNSDIIEKINNEKEFSDSLFNNEKIKINAFKVSTTNITSQKIILPKKADDKIINELSKFLQKEPQMHSCVPLKNSISSFAFDENASLNFAPKNLTTKEHLTESASDRGTLYHEILEKINFNNVNSEADVKQFIECNFAQEEIACLGILYSNIYNNIQKLKELIENNKILKEQKFVMKIKHSEIAGGDIDDNILVQGIIDLVIIKQNEIILVDYKLTTKQTQSIIEKYKKQVDLYALALSKQFKNVPIKKYILNLNKEELIKM